MNKRGVQELSTSFVRANRVKLEQGRNQTFYIEEERESERRRR